MHYLRFFSGSLRFVALVECLLLVFVCVNLQAGPVPSDKPVFYPAWWFEQDVIVRLDPEDEEPSWLLSYPKTDDYAAVNQGQLKAIATKAAAAMNDRLPGGAGVAVNALVAAWETPSASTDDYAVVNLGQLKAVAKPFYVRLISGGYAAAVPWEESSSESDDYAVANLGQVKNLFSFEISEVAEENLPPDQLEAESEIPVELHWNDRSSSEIGFVVERREGVIGSWMELGETAANIKTYTDSSATDHHEYYYRVAALYPEDEKSEYSNELQVLLGITLVPDVVSGEWQNPVSILLQWTASTPGAEEYRLERWDPVEGWVPVATFDASQLEYLDEWVSEGNSYQYRISAVNAGGDVLSIGALSSSGISYPDLSATPADDWDSDGINNAEDELPHDFFNGQTPQYSISNVPDEENNGLGGSITLKVNKPDGTSPWTNVLVRVSVESGDVRVGTTPSLSTVLRTDSSGIAQVTYQRPAFLFEKSEIKIRLGKFVKTVVVEPPTLAVVEFPMPGNATWGGIYDINSSGEAVGQVGGYRSVAWRGGEFVDLCISDWDWGASAIDDQGNIAVPGAGNSPVIYELLYDPAIKRISVTVDGQELMCQVMALNSSGTAGGSAVRDTPGQNDTSASAFLKPSGGSFGYVDTRPGFWDDNGVLYYVPSSGVLGISSDNRAVGYLWIKTDYATTNGTVAAKFVGSNPVPLEDTGPPYGGGSAVGVNSSGIIVGSNKEGHFVIWDENGHVNEVDGCQINSINDQNVAVGVSYGSDDVRGMAVYRNAEGVWKTQDLNAFLSPDSPYKILGAYKIKNSNMITGMALKNGRYVPVVLVPIDIQEVISDQIAGNEANKLPTTYFTGEPNNPMLMATRSGQNARLRVRLGAVNPRVYVGVRDVATPGTILASASAATITVPLTFQVPAHSHAIYEVAAGYDSNSNEILDSEEATILFDRTPKTDAQGRPSPKGLEFLDKIIIVDKGQADASQAVAEGYAGQMLTDYSGNLLAAFATGGETVDEAERTDNVPISSTQKGISHPLGALWNSSNMDTTYRFTFDSTSTAASEVRASKAFKSLVISAITANKVAMLAYSGTEEWPVSSWFDVHESVAFLDTEAYNFMRMRLGSAFNKVDIKGKIRFSYRKVSTTTIEIGGTEFIGGFDDLYDWAYGTQRVIFLGREFKAQEVSMVEAGYATLAPGSHPGAGKIFFTHMNLGPGFLNNWNREY